MTPDRERIEADASEALVDANGLIANGAGHPACVAPLVALVRREVEACCMAVCEHCRAGNKPKASKDYGAATPFVHLFQGYPPRACKAAAIRARGAKEGGAS